MTENSIKVWDPVVRVGHWTLVISFFTAYFTEDDLMTPHVWAGYVIGLVVCFRLIWGFVGTRHARFADFVRSPAVTFKYLADLVRHRSRRFTGHNPAGGMMIVVLLISLAGTVVSGIVLYGMEESAGPLAALVADYVEYEHFWEEVHEVLSNLTLLLVGLHIAGVLLSSYVHRENLVVAMLTGRKKKQL
jgi:cytochrome b